MKYKEKIIFEGNLNGWVCEGKPYIFDLGKIIKNGFAETEIEMPPTPLTERKTPNHKLHPFSGWEVKVFNQSSVSYGHIRDKETKEIIKYGKGKSNFAWRVGKYTPAKLKMKNDNNLFEEKVIVPNNFGGKHTYRIEFIEGKFIHYFDGVIVKIEHRKKAEFMVGKSFGIRYILLGRCNKYKVLIEGISFYKYKIGEYIEDDRSIDPDSPDDTEDNQDNNQDSEEVIKPEKKEPLSLKETWEMLKDKSKLIGIAIIILFLISIIFC